MSEDSGGTLRSQHDPQECDNCLQGLSVLLRTLDTVEEKTGRHPAVPIVLLMRGCELQWQPELL